MNELLEDFCVFPNKNNAEAEVSLCNFKTLPSTVLNIFPMSTDYIIKNLLNAVPSQKLVCNNIYNDQFAL